jgi:hypothetical protein
MCRRDRSDLSHPIDYGTYLIEPVSERRDAAAIRRQHMPVTAVDAVNQALPREAAQGRSPITCVSEAM